MSVTTLPPKKPVDASARLSWIAAVWSAFRHRDVDFFPRVDDGNGLKSMSAEDVLQEMNGESAHWNDLADNLALKSALEMAKYSLAEAKAQTEYQDQKATRILTITSFLGALSGALFTRLDSDYPLGAILRQKSTINAILISFDYATFILFVILSVSGALVTFHAIRTRFKYPLGQSRVDQEKDPKSLLFFASMIRSRPRSWIEAWVVFDAVGTPGGGAAIRSDLGQRYLQHVVKETYLIAAKTADKIRYLEPAQSLLAGSLKFLLIWIISLGLTSAIVPAATTSAKPIAVTISTAHPSGTTVTIPKKTGVPATVTKPATGTAGEH